MLRRIARLYPAFIVTLLCSLLFGFLLFSPEHLKTLSLTSINAFFAVSNFYFYSGSGYFDTSSATNPLLHTWTLSVEWQFYVIWPLLILCASKLQRYNIIYLLIITLIISLSISQAFTSINSVANYYMMPFRAFEFSIGGITMWLERRLSIKNRWLDIVLSLGMGLILYSALNYTSATPFPGVHALLPTIGASLCILGVNSKHLGFALNNSLMAYIGKISYSLYLVHWPVIVFYNYYIYREITNFERLVLLLTSFVLAVLMYSFVEDKYRKVNIIKLNKSTLIYIASAMTLFLTTSAFVFHRDGMIYKSSVDELVSESIKYGGEGYSQGNYDLGYAEAEKVTALFMGDSYARQYAEALDDVLKNNKMKYHVVFNDACFFSKKFTSIDNGPRQVCFDKLNYTINYLSKNKDVPLIFTINWGGYPTIISGSDGKQVTFEGREYYDFVLNNLKELSEVVSNKIIIVGTPPGIISGAANISACLQRPTFSRNNCEEHISINKFRGNSYALNQEIKAYANNNPRIRYVDSTEAFCVNDQCAGVDKGLYVYSDRHHLSKYGATKLVNHFRHILLNPWPL